MDEINYVICSKCKRKITGAYITSTRGNIYCYWCAKKTKVLKTYMKQFSSSKKSHP